FSESLVRLTGSLNCLFTCSITSLIPSSLPSIASSFSSSPRPNNRVACQSSTSINCHQPTSSIILNN
uniref:Uncharacterized protein n=1 Tax=Oryza brachyantha TaxID=4533 RepID=J3MZB6_ORYBR